uniref:Uncharacterized protein n=1 Tax=Bionectria ochroleuca TaxID=29856 RepID=A0A0B7JJI4_BIOOC
MHGHALSSPCSPSSSSASLLSSTAVSTRSSHPRTPRGSREPSSLPSSFTLPSSCAAVSRVSFTSARAVAAPSLCRRRTGSRLHASTTDRASASVHPSLLFLIS